MIDRRALVAAATLSTFVALPAFGQTALPSREQIQLPSSESQLPSGEEARVQRPLDTQACSFSQSSLTAEITALTFAGPTGEALPGAVQQVLASVMPRPGEQPISQLCILRDEAAARLRTAGYIAAVTIPAQEVVGGHARLTVILGRLVDIRVEGGGSRARAAFARQAERLMGLYPLRSDDLERELLLASDVPGRQVQMALQPAGTAPGELIGVVTLRSTRFAATLNANNLGSKPIGRENGSVRFEAFGLTGFNDVTFIGASATADFEEQLTVQGGHYLSLDNGVTFGGSVAYAWSRPTIGALDFRSESLLGVIEARTPLVRGIRSRADVSAGLELVEQTSTLGGGNSAVPITRDKLRIAFLRLQGRLAEPMWGGGESHSVGGTFELRQGLDVLGATDGGAPDAAGYFPSKLQGDPTAFVVRGGLNSSVALTRRFSLSGTVQAQWSADPLLNFEEFSVGNYTLGRGYDPSTTSGDSALGGRIEPTWLLPIENNRPALQVYGFLDAVRIWNEDAGSMENGRNLRSAGLGLRATVPGNLMLDVGWAHPIDAPLAQAGAVRASDRFLISLSARFSPADR